MFVPNFIHQANLAKKANSIMTSKPRFAETADSSSFRATGNAQKEYFMLRSQFEKIEVLLASNR